MTTLVYVAIGSFIGSLIGNWLFFKLKKYFTKM